MFATLEQRKKIAAQQAAKKKAAAERQAKINKSSMVALKKPTTDNTYVKKPAIQKTAAQVTKERRMMLDKRMADAVKNPDEVGSYRGLKSYTKNNFTVYQVKKKK